ncbi:MAG: hypothetical protein DRR19_15940 [Candidatus Parabeggiatoa sp. nov. 1]|nr:MAG: hypothetical protein DRR19_15940 [Gammaproteobacteria bacterium]
MKKTLVIVAASTLSFGISSVVSAGGIEKAERYCAPLEQNVVEMDVSAVEPGYVDALVQTELELGNKELGSNHEIQESHKGGGIYYDAMFWFLTRNLN